MTVTQWIAIGSIEARRYEDKIRIELDCYGHDNLLEGVYVVSITHMSMSPRYVDILS